MSVLCVFLDTWLLNEDNSFELIIGKKCFRFVSFDLKFRCLHYYSLNIAHL